MGDSPFFLPSLYVGTGISLSDQPGISTQSLNVLSGHLTGSSPEASRELPEVAFTKAVKQENLRDLCFLSWREESCNSPLESCVLTVSMTQLASSSLGLLT